MKKKTFSIPNKLPKLYYALKSDIGGVNTFNWPVMTDEDPDPYGFVSFWPPHNQQKKNHTEIN